MDTAAEQIAEQIAGFNIRGPHVLYVDPDASRANVILLTFEIPRGASILNDLTDRERALLRAMLHLAQDRLDASNPHD